MYRVQAIILYRQIIRDNQVRTVLFSQDFGKITAWEKGNQGGDIGSTVEVLIERSSGHNQLKKLDILSLPSLSTWSYTDIEEYLYLFQMLYVALPDGVEHMGLYRDISYFIRKIDTLVGKVCFITYMQARVMKQLGYLDKNHYTKNPALTHFYRNTLSGNIQDMLAISSGEIPEYESIRSSVLEARHTYTYRT